LVHCNWYENYDKSDGSMDVKCLKEIGSLLTRIWKLGVMSFTNDELQIDDDDREDINWWLEGVQSTFKEMTGKGIKGSVIDDECDLMFEYDPAP